MANYANSAGFSKAFNNLTGLLNMFIQDRLNRKNVQEDREYNDKTYEQKFMDNLVGNAVKYAQNGKADLYGTYYDEPISNGTRTVNIMGKQQEVPVAAPQRIVGEKIENIDYPAIVAGLRSGDIVSRANENSADNIGNNSNKLIEIEESLIDPINKVYGTKFAKGTKLPAGVYTSMISGLNANNRRNSGLTDKQLLDLYNNLDKRGSDILTGDEVKNSDLYNLVEYLVDKRFQTKSKSKEKANKDNDPLGIRNL